MRVGTTSVLTGVRPSHSVTKPKGSSCCTRRRRPRRRPPERPARAIRQILLATRDSVARPVWRRKGITPRATVPARGPFRRRASTATGGRRQRERTFGVSKADGRETIERGVAGASARAEYERRHARDEARRRARFGRLAPVVELLAGPKASTEAWARGAEGEERVGPLLDEVVGRKGFVLHDRRVPGRRLNLDHLVVMASGVWVIDTKHYHGRLSRRRAMGWFNASRSTDGGWTERESPDRRGSSAAQRSSSTRCSRTSRYGQRCASPASKSDCSPGRSSWTA